MAGNKQGINVSEFWDEFLLRDGFDTEGTLRAKFFAATDGIVDNADGTYTINFSDGSDFEISANEITGITFDPATGVVTVMHSDKDNDTFTIPVLTTGELAEDAQSIVFQTTGTQEVTVTGNFRGPQGIPGVGNRWFTGASAPIDDTTLAETNGDLFLVETGADLGNYYSASNVTGDPISTTTWTLEGNLRGPSGVGGFDIRATDADGNPLDITTTNTVTNPVATTAYVNSRGNSNADDLVIVGNRLRIDEDGTPVGDGIVVDSRVVENSTNLISSGGVFDSLDARVALSPTSTQVIAQPTGTQLEIRGSLDIEDRDGNKAIDFSGTSGDWHWEHNGEIYGLVDKDQKKMYYDTTNTASSFPTTGRAGKEIVIKDDLTLLADEITAIEIQRNSAGQSLEQWENAGNSASTFVADSSNSLTEVSLANNLNLLANDNYSKMIVATENGNNYHFDLLYFAAKGGRLVLQTDNLVTRLANIDTAISNAGGDATKKEAATSTWQASLADQYVIGDEVTVVRNGNGLINDRRVYIRTNANPGATTTDPGAQTYAVQGDSDPFPNIYVSANGNWGLLRRTGVQWRVGQDYIEGDKITQIVDDLPQDYFVIKRHTSTSTSKPSDPGTVYVKNGSPDTGNNLNDIFQRPIESIELLTNVPNTVYEETDTSLQVTVGSVGDAAGNTTTFILGTNGIIQQGGLASDLQVGHLVGFTTTPNDFTTVADNGGNGFEVTIVETVTLGDGNDYTRVTVSGDLNLIAGSNNFLYRLAHQSTLVQAHQLNFNRGIEDTPLGGNNPNGLVEIGLTNTGVTAGEYTNTNLTVDEARSN